MKRKNTAFFALFLSAVLFFSGSENLSGNPGLETTPCSSIAEDAVITSKKVIPGGNSIGVVLCCDGVLVVSTADVTTTDGSHRSPAKDAGIKPGDVIKSFNKSPVTTVEKLNTAISTCNGKRSAVVLERNNKAIETLLIPSLSARDGTYRIGAWVKDAASGIGTMTFYDPETKSFAALGHGICDPETGNILNIDTGSILNSTIVSVNKGTNGVPGELNGVFIEDKQALGEIKKNCNTGIYGIMDIDSFSSAPIPIAKRDEVTEGKASILANIEGQKVEEFEIEISKILPKALSAQKSFIIKVTDKSLLSKTGGIVQGMSGSPIIQDGKLVGAVTHVFVNDPTRGYGIFIENMLAEK